MNDLMIDLETWGTNPGCVVVQIGACFFDNRTGQIGDTFSYNIDARDSVKQGFVIEVDTVLWWLNQDKAAQDAVHRNPVIVQDTLIAFNRFLQDKKVDRVWCHKGFDFPLLAAYYRKMGMTFPLNHWTFRDLHTILDLAKMNIKNRKRSGIFHNGLDDCRFQVEYLVEALRIING